MSVEGLGPSTKGKRRSPVELVPMQQPGGVCLYALPGRGPVAAREDLGAFATITYSSNSAPAYVLRQFLSLLSDGDSDRELLSVRATGYTELCSDDVEEQLEGFANDPDTASAIRLSFVSETLGQISLMFQRELPGLSTGTGAVSITAVAGEFYRADCVRNLIAHTVESEIESSVLTIAGVHAAVVA